ncbi:ferric reductase like transmembrane component domain-containing protein [Trichoderma breve]|uniref:Ferric reductase like transmembrane component domain-containing protein n=1 Tax=Trichoderma breve TaxID=2034170 RepID=A0A9W9E9T0_9HYPO|nr:ferric reductase like transmembrane component domain-containing protein [Trichoderma breve]KAJ4862477.1 ferric reductase like transmembrane component domain-containing protein [Trichoderma breve]
MKHLLGVSLTLVGLFTSHGHSRVISKDQECVSAVFGIVGGLNFEGIGYGNYYLGICQNPLKVVSTYAISKTYCSSADLGPGFEYLNWACLQYAGAGLIPEADVAVNLTDEAISRYPILDQDDVIVPKNLTTPVMVTRDWFDLGFRTEDTWDYELRTHPTYGWAMYGFWGGILLIGMLRRLITYIVESRLSPLSTDPEDLGAADSREKPTAGTKSLAYMYSRIRKHLTIPSGLPPYHSQLLFGCTIPTRIESLVIISCWILNFVLCCVNYRGFEGNLYWSAVSPQIWRYISDRAGIIAYANLPLMWMFSGRNNIFIWLTGWSFSTFNLFHRHIARIATLQAIIHSVGYTVFYFEIEGESNLAEGYKLQWHDAWFYLGAVATIAMSILVFSSFSWFRRRIYDSFLLLHILLSVVLIVALFYHTSIFDGEYNPYLWPLVAIWCFDRFLRIVRVVYCNLHVQLHKKTLHRSTAAISYDQDANFIQIDINTHVKPGPGKHYYLYQPFRFTGWENHPLTLAYWSQSAVETSQSQQRDDTTDPPSKTAAIEGEYLLSFWIRPYDGWTRHLRDQCLKSQPLSKLPSIITETILLEGPYGIAEPLWTFDEVLLIAGGSGITAMVPYILDHIARTASSNKSSQTRIRGLTLIWTNPKEAFIRRIAQRELAAALKRDDVRATESGVLKGKEETDISESADGADEACSLPITMCRPDIPAIIEKAAASATESGSRLAVMSCGPGKMSDAAREATYRAIRQQNNSVEYFEESFGW